jgi:3-oxoacyl-[acyl-carrier protein] reductase
MLLEGKTALITGASSGLGAATAVLFAKEGARVAVNYHSNAEDAEEIERKIKQAGGKAVCVQGDVSVPCEVRAMFERVIGEFGGLDILVNNAGIDCPKKFAGLTLVDWDRTLKTNLYGVFLCSQEAAKVMLEQKKGKILNTASVRGLTHCGRKGNIVYTVSKAAVISFTTTLAKELAPWVSVNAVAPGPANTRISKKWGPKTREGNVRRSLLKRLVEPEDVANAFLYLASEMGDALTGEILVVDGGYNLQ